MKKFFNFLNNITANILLLFTIISLPVGAIISCKSDKDIVTNTEVPTQDTIIVERMVVDTVYIRNTEIEDSLRVKLTFAEDSLKFYRDSIQYKDWVNARRCEKVKYYISICDKKPTNKKFFFGWIKRVMSEE